MPFCQSMPRMAATSDLNRHQGEPESTTAKKLGVWLWPWPTRTDSIGSNTAVSFLNAADGLSNGSRVYFSSSVGHQVNGGRPGLGGPDDYRVFHPVLSSLFNRFLHGFSPTDNSFFFVIQSQPAVAGCFGKKIRNIMRRHLAS